MSFTDRQGSLSLHLSLPKAACLWGEAGRAEVTLRNDGAAAVGLQGARFAELALLDERGEPPLPWPWPEGRHSGPHILRPVPPGQERSAPCAFQVPPQEQAAGHTYAPRVGRADQERDCGPWPASDSVARPPYQLLDCLARRLVGGSAASALRVERLSWAEAAILLAVDPADGPGAERAVWLVELAGERPLSTAVVLDIATGEPYLLLIPPQGQ